VTVIATGSSSTNLCKVPDGAAKPAEHHKPGGSLHVLERLTPSQNISLSENK
jgi:hypothetical protein